MSSKSLIAILFLIVQSCNGQVQKKINGVSFVASREAVNESHINPIVNINANYAAIMPFGFIKNLEHPEVVYNTERQWFGETLKGAKQYMERLQEKHIKIMLKPQIWVWKGEFTGQIKMTNETDWKVLEASYSKFILDYALLAQEMKVEIFCIGTELENFVSHRPLYWKRLIKDVRAIYKGKLTYAANWNEYGKTPFWNQLDFIGIDAYFPVSDSKTPTVAECIVGWKEHMPSIKEVSFKNRKSILFTEFGYRSIDYAGKEPWRTDRSMNQVNVEAQTNTTQALFETFWKQDWFAGGFVWKWHHNHDVAGGLSNDRFTPQNKPVETVIKRQFSL